METASDSALCLMPTLYVLYLLRHRVDPTDKEFGEGGAAG